MNELTGMLTAINALGEKINTLEDELRFSRYRAENLEAENAALKKKLDEVKSYIAPRMEGK